MSGSLDIRMSVCPDVCMSGCLDVRMPACLHVRMSVCPDVLMSLCPDFYMSECMDVQMSKCKDDREKINRIEEARVLVKLAFTIFFRNIFLYLRYFIISIRYKMIYSYDYR